MYSQNDEEEVILEYFKGREEGRFLDIGAADGKTLSNVRALYELGWRGVLVEPNPYSFMFLLKNYPEGDCKLVNVAVSLIGGLQKFYLTNDMVSTFDEAHRKLWENIVKYQEAYVNVLSVVDLLKSFPGPYPFINIDVEGMNWDILTHIPLESLGCELICIEFGEQKDNIVALLEDEGWKLIHKNAENFIYARPEPDGE